MVNYKRMFACSFLLESKSNKLNQVCKLDRNMYGLKQKSRKWYEKRTSTLIHNDYVLAHVDHSPFTKHDKNTFTLLLVYVDDIIIAGNSDEEFNKIKSVFQN